MRSHSDLEQCQMRPKVVIESAFAPSLFTKDANIEFAQRLCARASRDGYNPIASHL